MDDEWGNDRFVDEDEISPVKTAVFRIVYALIVFLIIAGLLSLSLYPILVGWGLLY